MAGKLSANMAHIILMRRYAHQKLMTDVNLVDPEPFLVRSVAACEQILLMSSFNSARQ